jgi:putative chitinase
MKVTINQMKQLGWNSITQKSVDELNAGIIKFKIASINELRHFLSQVSHECGCGRWATEIWGPTKIQLSYEGRTSLGNNCPGDGFKFRGAGYIQMTGRHNYTSFSKYMNDPKIVEIGAKYIADNYCWMSAFYWWINNGMSKLCSTNPSVATVTRRVNGGENGLASREAFYKKCCSIFTDSANNSKISQKSELPILKVNLKTNDAAVVKTLQKTLNTRGFNCGITSGIFDDTTCKAVKAFQTKTGLTADGIVGPNTWAALGL